jgi:hypothetical protein
MRITEMTEQELQFQQTAAGTREKKRPIRCDVERCGLPAISSVELHFFCLYHFISHCYERLEHCNAAQVWGLSSERLESEHRFLRECAEQAANLVCPLRGFDNLDRARLFDIFLWASELIARRAGAEVGSRAKLRVC